MCETKIEPKEAIHILKKMYKGTPTTEQVIALDMAYKALEKQGEMMEHCSGSCTDCPYHNPFCSETECMNDFIIE